MMSCGSGLQRQAAAIAWAARDERILLTFDKDFGELAKHRRCLRHAESSCFAFLCRDLITSDNSLQA
jgi:hypothetical protein